MTPLLYGLMCVTLAAEPAAKPAELSAKEVKEHWDTLAGESAEKAWQSMWALAGSPKQAVPFLEKQFKPVVPADPAKVEKLIKELDDAKFPVRQKATEELEKMGDLVEAALEKAREAKPSVETLGRIDRLLDKLKEG